MQKACEMNPSTMAAIIALPDEKVEEICASIDGIVVPANYNCPGQLVISGTKRSHRRSLCQTDRSGRQTGPETQRRRRLPLPADGTARVELEAAIQAAPFAKPICPVYQNVDANPIPIPQRSNRT